MADEVPVDESVDSGFIAPEDLPQRIRVGDDPDPDGAGVDPEEDEPTTPVTELTPEERSQFRTLLTIGRRTKKVPVFDHSIVIRSLNCDDEIRVGDAVKGHEGSRAFPRAYQCAVVAAAIQSVDGEPWGTSLAAVPDPDEVFRRKQERVLEYHPLVVQMIYNAILEMDSEFGELVAKLGKL